MFLGCVYLLIEFCHTNFAMAILMTSFQKRLVNQLIRKAEKYVEEEARLPDLFENFFI